MHTATEQNRDPGFASFWGHPRPLWMLMGVTVWFNFAFYGFRAYIVPYIAENFYPHLSSAQAMQNADVLSAGFLALMYATPIIGGYVADKILGEVQALSISLWLGVLSLLLMALPSLAGFEIGMALFALTVGLSVPLTVLIGLNYAKGDARREGGYTLYYMAINFGAAIAPFICGTFIGQLFGYRWGFIAAAAGMALAAVLFQLFHRILRPALPEGEHLPGPMATLWVLIAIAVLVYPTALLLAWPSILHWAMYILMGLLVVYVIVGCVRRRNRVQTHRYIALLLLFVGLVMFWTFSFQGYSSLNFFARDHVSAPFNYIAFQSFNPLYILIFAPFMAMLWPWLEKRHKDPSTSRKYGIGLLLAACGFGVMAWAIYQWGGDGAKINWGVLAVCYLLLTIGELALSPIGYSLIGQLAAPEETSLVMGGWFFGYALAYLLAGWIAEQTTPGNMGTALSGMAAYAHVYSLLFWFGLAVAIVFLVAAPWIQRLMHGVH